MTITTNTAPLAALLAEHEDCAATLFALLASHTGDAYMVALYEHVPRLASGDTSPATIDRILEAGYAAGLLSRITWRGVYEYSMAADDRYALAKHRGGALGWLRERCGVAAESGAVAAPKENV